MKWLLFLCLVAGARAEEAKLYLQLGHSHHLTSVAISPDSRLLLTGSEDRTARLWDAASGVEVRLFRGHSDQVTSVAFSAGGGLVYTASEDRTARLWNTATGAELRRLEGHSDGLTSIAVSPDSRFVLTGSKDKTARLWDPIGPDVVRFEGHTAVVTSVAFSPDGQTVLTGSEDDTARLWDAASGRELRRFVAHSQGITSVAFSPDGRFILTGGEDNIARMWDVSSGAEVRQFRGHEKALLAVAFSPDGRLVLTSAVDDTARLWDAATGSELRRFSGNVITSVAFSSDGRRVATASWDNARLWDTDSGSRLLEFRGYSKSVYTVAQSPDGRFLLAGGEESIARLWDTTTGVQVRSFNSYDGLSGVTSVAFSPDGRQLLTGGLETGAKLWDAAGGRQLREFQVRLEGALSAAFSPDGRQVLTGGASNVAVLWDASSGVQIRRFNGHSRWIVSVAFSPDGRFVLTGSEDHTARLWDLSTGAEIHQFPGHTDRVMSVAFSPDGRYVLTGSDDFTARLWDTATGSEIRRFQGFSGRVESVTFSPDGRMVLAGSGDGTALLWDAASGAEIRRFSGNASGVTSVLFSRDGRFVIDGSEDGTVRLWKASSGEWLATLVSFEDGGWAVVDPEGRYDASDPKGIQGLHWLVGTFRTIGLAQLRRSFYTPGLLGSIFREAPLPPVRGLNDVACLPPVVVLERDQQVLRVKLTAIDKAGFGRVALGVNGRPFPAQPIARKKDGDAEILEFRMNNARFAEGGNQVTVTAASFDNLIESDPAVVVWQQDAPARGTVPNRSAASAKLSSCAGRFYGIFVGTGTFPFAPELSLKYPESDAKGLAEAVRLGAEALCGKDRVEVTTLTTDNPEKSLQPTKENIHRAFQSVAAKSTRKDLLFVYLAGHGATPRNDPHSYFYLTQDARQVEVDIADQLRNTTTISAAELAEWLINPNLPDKQVLILDTCAAGAANVQLSMLTAKARSVSDDLKKAVDNWNLDTGTYILMGSARDQASYESDRFRHGLLTYALLRGMKGDALLDGLRLEAAHWFETTIPAVEKYAAMIGREQKPVKAVPNAAGGIPIAFVTPAVRDRIVVAEPAPEILKLTMCYQEPVQGPLRDSLKLGSLIRSELRALSSSTARGADIPVSYNDNTTEGSPDALTPQVRYRVEGAQLKVTLSLLQGETTAGEASLTVGADPQAAAKEIADRLVKLAVGK